MMDQCRASHLTALGSILLTLVIATSGPIPDSRAADDFESAARSEFFELHVNPDSGECRLIFAGRRGEERVRLPAIELDGVPQAGFSAGDNGGYVNDTGRVTVTTLGPRAVALEWTPKQDRLYDFVLRIADNSHYYGGGERFQALNQKGYILPMRSTDHPEPKGVACYKPVPFFMSARGYGFWIDNPAEGLVDLNATDRFHIIARYRVPALRVVLFAGPAYTDLLTAFTNFSGRSRVPPAWAFAPWKSRDVHESRAAVLEDVEKLRKLDLPASVLVIDSPWETAYNNFELNRTQFPDPDSLFARVNALGFHVCFWLTPFMNSRNVTDMRGIQSEPSDAYHEARAAGYLVTGPDGSPLTTEWWKGDGALVDFTNPRAVEWWHERLAKTQRWGARAFKCDAGEGQFVGPSARFANGAPAWRMHNEYALRYLETMDEYVQDALGGDGVLLARSGFTGMQVFPGCWAGDNEGYFYFDNGLPTAILAGQNAALSGLPIWGSDIAGYIGRQEKAVFIRWTQFGCFSPIMLVHMMSNLGPWDFDAETLEIYRDYAKLHTQLFPYIYQAAHEASRTGLPIIRPMVLAFDGDRKAADHIYQYMFGPDLLVAPVYAGGTQRTLFLPEGDWVDYWSGERFEGGQRVTVAAPLHEIPVFVRPGTLIEMLPADVDTLIKPYTELADDVVPLDERRELHVWDGGDAELTSWDGLEATLEKTGNERRLTIASSPPRPLTVVFRTAAGPLVKVPSDAERTVDAAHEQVRLHFANLSEPRTITW